MRFVRGVIVREPAGVDTPDGPPRAWALFAHCFTCSKDTKAAAYVARALAEAGYGVLRFDFTGLGGSGGDFANTHFSSNVDDLVGQLDDTQRARLLAIADKCPVHRTLHSQVEVMTSAR